ncbi:hypothetical protein [Actomonas aquatica]|uniref:Beta-hexosaminidase bacterial type N-terminal domain-containing protein n=1 Tax=Actomonas aquatica TaxID=2866162 RepID=A0ABZ1CDZ0_9BACT|nr:hypothetical protein [Opitutus sp. WL0086]WRQ89703.1 hypothetical protein K1X11_009815 [Opitutus sp. WL0086]
MLNRRFPAFALLVVLVLAPVLRADVVRIVPDDTQRTSAYAVARLTAALAAAGHEVVAESGEYDFLISLATHPTRLRKEAFEILPEDKVITIYGGDGLGMVYGALALVEALQNGTALGDVAAQAEKPDQAFRGIKFNLPWETYRPSSALDQHIETAKDPAYWAAFLDMMVDNRFNAISLWNMHPYTFMVRPRSFPEASPWTEAEFAEWQGLYRQIFAMAKDRGLDTYIVHWSIFVSRELAEAHGLAEDNFYPYYYVEGERAELVRRYLRESVKQVLTEYPDLDGIGLSHGEGMAGMTPLERQQWMDDVIIAGMQEVTAERPVKLIHRVPFSANLDSGGSTSKNVEVVTREAMERLGDTFEGPIWVEMKFNWSHAHSTPKLEKVHGGKLGDTYFDPVPSNYRVTWQARNEDFFALRWGVPEFIRQHIALNGQAAYAGGYFVGSECYIPALDYFTAVDEPVDWTWAFERQWLFYKLWGRLLYNPETPDAVFAAEYERRYGVAGRNLLAAMSLASSTQLRLASLYESRWDFTLYSEGFLALQGDYTRYIGVDALINQGTMASEYVSVRDYVETTLAGGGFGAGRITPPILADMLERDCAEALRLVEWIDTSANASLRFEVADIQTWAWLGRHLAAKLRGAVALATYRRTGESARQEEAVRELGRALVAWDEVIDITRPLYRDMRLTHYNHNVFTANDDNLFHWALIRDEVAADVTVAREAVPTPKATAVD